MAADDDDAVGERGDGGADKFYFKDFTNEKMDATCPNDIIRASFLSTLKIHRFSRWLSLSRVMSLACVEYDVTGSEGVFGECTAGRVWVRETHSAGNSLSYV